MDSLPLQRKRLYLFSQFHSTNMFNMQDAASVNAHKLEYLLT